MKNNSSFEIISECLECQTDQEKLFTFLSNIKNFETILPKDKIQNCKITDNKISFEIENIITLTLYVSNSYASNNHPKFQYIQYASEPFGDYYLTLKAEFENNKSKIILSGSLNPFVLSIANKKLSRLVQKINLKLSELVI